MDSDFLGLKVCGRWTDKQAVTNLVPATASKFKVHNVVSPGCIAPIITVSWYGILLAGLLELLA
jgi:hypothetical protein